MGMITFHDLTVGILHAVHFEKQMNVVQKSDHMLILHESE